MDKILTDHQRSMPTSSLSSNTGVILESSNIIYLIFKLHCLTIKQFLFIWLSCQH